MFASGSWHFKISRWLFRSTDWHISQVEPSAFAPLGLGPDVVTPSRAINFANLLETARKRVLTLVEQPPRFPSLVISAERLEPQGDFAKAQAQYLMPNAAQVDRLVKVSAPVAGTQHQLQLHRPSICRFFSFGSPGQSWTISQSQWRDHHCKRNFWRQSNAVCTGALPVF